MTTPRPPRNRFGATTFVTIVLGALLAIFPATAVLGLLLLLLALVPAVIAYVLTRTGRATDRRRSLASLVLAPVFLIVAAGVVGANAPATPVTMNGSPAAVGDTNSLAASPTSTPSAAPVVDAPVLAAPGLAAPAVEATGTTQVPQRALAAAAATAKATASRSVATKAPVAKAPVAKAPASKTAAAAKSSAPTKSSASQKPSSSCDSATHYINSSGSCVLRPTDPGDAPGGASAKCKDGTLSFSQHRSGTCSRHGGVAQWLAAAPKS
jgi:resuscitation-promoting factor RpfB